MNSEQLQDWLTVVNEQFKIGEKAVKDIDKEVQNSHYLVNFLYSSYSDVNKTQPVLAQVLASYYRGGNYFFYLLILVYRKTRSLGMKKEAHFLIVFVNMKSHTSLIIFKISAFY